MRTSNKAVNARSRKGDGAKSADSLPSPGMGKRIAWVLAAGVWVFLFVSLLSFSSADEPSHVVAVHNAPTANLCGLAGATIAYWAYHVIGYGAWMIMAGLGIFLGVTVSGRSINDPMVRLVGLMIMALAFSSVHGLLFPNAGPLTGSQSGLVAQQIVYEMTPRFSTVGTLLVILAAFGLGAVVAIDQIVFSIPKWTRIALGWTSQFRLPQFPMPTLPSLRWKRSAQPALQGAGITGHDAGVSTEQTGRARANEEKVFRGRKIKSISPMIDPDAGGIGATDSFDPDVHELDGTDEGDRGLAASMLGEEAALVFNDTDNATPEETIIETKPERELLTAEELRAKIAKLPVRMTGSTKVVARDEDIPREENYDGYQFPTLDLLGDPESNFSAKMEAFVRQQAQQLEEALHTYGIDGEVVGIESGPVVTLYSVQLAPGTKVAKVTAISSDIARSLSAQNIRIVSNMAGKTTVGIEVPNLQKEKVRLKELMSGETSKGMNLPMFLGKDAAGELLVADLTRMPHMLIAGTTGSGKSVCMNTIIMSWLYTKRPDELKLVLVDPKMVEMSQFADIPHLMCPVVTEMSKAAAILEWAVNKMEERYEIFREAMVRDIAGYNAMTDEEKFAVFNPQNDLERAKIPKKLPYMVFIIDELADLILTNKEVEHFIVRIAQKARAVGIHLILATQRPQANVVTGLIKSNMPCRVAFKVASGMDSRIVLDQKGAELLLGQGDMLFLTPHTSEVKRAQATLVTDGETRKVVSFLRNVAAPTFERSLVSLRAMTTDGDEGVDGLSPSERDPMFDEAVRIMIESGRGSVSLLQRRLAIGYSRASRLVDQMGQAGILGDHKGSVAREVLISLEDWEQMKRMEEDAAKNGTLFQDSQDDDAMGEMSMPDDDVPEVETVKRDQQGAALDSD
jgi:DNA segregation ATPase FtsK/SpoIIIE, S-DNA-T family